MTVLIHVVVNGAFTDGRSILLKNTESLNTQVTAHLPFHQIIFNTQHVCKGKSDSIVPNAQCESPLSEPEESLNHVSTDGKGLARVSFPLHTPITDKTGNK